MPSPSPHAGGSRAPPSQEHGRPRTCPPAPREIPPTARAEREERPGHESARPRGRRGAVRLGGPRPRLPEGATPAGGAGAFEAALPPGLRGKRKIKLSGQEGGSGPPRSPQLLGATPPSGDPLAPPSRMPPSFDVSPPAAPGLRGSGAAPTPQNSLREPPARRAPQRLREPNPPARAAAPGTRPLPSALRPSPSPAATPPLSPLTTRRHFPRSSALNRKLAAQPAAATATAAASSAATTDSAAAAAALAVVELRSQQLEPRRGGRRDM